MSKKILLLPGDGIGPEVIAEAEKVMHALSRYGLQLEIDTALIGGAAYDSVGDPLPQQTLQAAYASDAVLLGAVGAPRYDSLPADMRPEGGLLRFRQALGVFANLRPAAVMPELLSASCLRSVQAKDMDVLIVRELTGGIYFGEPRGERLNAEGRREAYNTMRYSEDEIERIAHTAFAAARQRQRRLCSVDKANVLEVSKLWREVMNRVARDYPEVDLSHLYVDNAAMQLVRQPGQFDVIVTGNLFGDILSDLAAMLTGSIGLLPSASLDAGNKGLYEPVHGSAPDIAGQGLANPLAAILSVAMLLRYSLSAIALAEKVERAVKSALAQVRTADLNTNLPVVKTAEMGDRVVASL